ncbi:DsrE/DsrF/DrsH-like family protein [Pseudomonadota bacterium]
MAEVLNPDRPQKLSIVVFSGNYDKVHYALVMASAAAATDTPVTLFFTMEASRCMLGHNGDNVGECSWGDQSTSTCTETGADMDARFKTKGVADFETLLSACVEMRVRFLVCEMGLKAMDLKREDLRPDVNFEPGGVVTFLNDAQQDGSVIFI